MTRYLLGVMHYRAAAKCTTSLPEHRYLATQVARLKMEEESKQRPS